MIPTTDNVQSINPEIVELTKKFPERIEAWKERLQELHYLEFFVVSELPDVIFKNHLQIAHSAEDSGFYTFEHADCDIGIGNYHSFSSSSFNEGEDTPFDPDLVIAAGTFVSKEQWNAQESWFRVPGSDSDFRYNGYLAINFRLGNKAEIIYDHESDSLDDELLAWPRDRFTFEGTWGEVYNHLVKLIEEAMLFITIPETDG